MTPMTAEQALGAAYLEIRSRLLDLAATLDRIDRGGGADSDRRAATIRGAISALATAGPARAEAVQRVFSLEYEPAWERPVAR